MAQQPGADPLRPPSRHTEQSAGSGGAAGLPQIVVHGAEDDLAGSRDTYAMEHRGSESALNAALLAPHRGADSSGVTATTAAAGAAGLSHAYLPADEGEQEKDDDLLSIASTSLRMMATPSNVQLNPGYQPNPAAVIMHLVGDAVASEPSKMGASGPPGQSPSGAAADGTQRRCWRFWAKRPASSSSPQGPEGGEVRGRLARLR